MMAFPIRVAPKKVQKGTRKWPQVIPARSKRGLGIWNVHIKYDWFIVLEITLVSAMWGYRLISYFLNLHPKWHILSEDCIATVIADQGHYKHPPINTLTEAQAKIPKNPTFCTICWTPSFALVTKSCKHILKKQFKHTLLKTDVNG